MGIQGCTQASNRAGVLGPRVAALVFVALSLVFMATASGVSAAPGHFTADAYPAPLHGSAIVGKSNSFTAGGSTYECASASFAGQLTEKATELTLEPTFGTCSAGEGTPATVTGNGCDYIFRSGEGTESEFPVTTDLECSGEKPIEIHRYSSPSHGSSTTCTLTIAEQTGLKGLTYTKEPETNSFVLEGTMGLVVETHGACSFGFTLKQESSQHVNVTIQATSLGHFTADAYPAHLDGVKVKEKANAITMAGTTVECNSTFYTGDLSGEATELTIEPEYGGGCFKGTDRQTITINACHYVYHSGEGTEAEFPITMDIECPGAKGIEIHGYSNATAHNEGTSNCTTTIPEQTGLKGLSYTEEPETDSFIIEGTVKAIANLHHGLCTFGFTLANEVSQHVSVTVQAE